VTNQSKYEFFHRPRPDGAGVYLYRVRTENNNNVTDIVYHETFGKPVSIIRDGQKTDYTYYDNGFVRTKKEPGRLMAFEYKNACNKVSQVTMNFYEDAVEPAKGERKPTQAKTEKLVRTTKTHFSYEANKCNLLTAENSEGQTVKLQYDQQGRIAQIEDQSKKLVKIRYEAKFGKPAVVTRPGLGTIQVTYKNDGEIQKVESKEGPNVAVQVASIFNNLLDIIAPATGETPL
jgi:YD repeat-containing protein